MSSARWNTRHTWWTLVAVGLTSSACAAGFFLAGNGTTAHAQSSRATPQNAIWYRVDDQCIRVGDDRPAWTRANFSSEGVVEITVGDARLEVVRLGPSSRPPGGAFLIQRHAAGSTTTGVQCEHDDLPKRANLILSRPGQQFLHADNCMGSVDIACGPSAPTRD